MKKIDDYIAASQKSYHDMTEHIDMINKFDTKKSVVFENIDNMMGQLEPLLKNEGGTVDDNKRSIRNNRHFNR